MRNLSKRLVLSAILLAVAAALSGCRGSRTGSAEAIHVAVNVPLTGPIAAATGPYPDGLRMGIEDGLAEQKLGANRIILDVQDNEGKPAQAVAVFQKQTLSGFQVYASGVSDMTMAFIDQLDKTAVPDLLVAFDAYMPDKGPNRIRILPNFKLEGPLYLKFAQGLHAKRVFSVSHSSPVNEELFSAIIEPGLSQAGVEFNRERVDWGTKDFRTIALKARKFKPDAILINAFSAEAYPLLSALRTAGLLKAGTVYCGMDFIDLLHNNTPRSELTGISFTAPYIEIPAHAQAHAQWASRFQQRFNGPPTYIAAYAYDTGRILAKALALGNSVTTETILKAVPYDGVTGLIQLDQHRDLASTLTIGYVNENGEVVEGK